MAGETDALRPVCAWRSLERFECDSQSIHRDPQNVGVPPLPRLERPHNRCHGVVTPFVAGTLGRTRTCDPRPRRLIRGAEDKVEAPGRDEDAEDAMADEGGR